MTQLSRNSRLTTFLDTTDFMGHETSRTRIDKVVDGTVTLSAIPDGSGSRHWEARTAEGKLLPLFRLRIESDAAAFRGPVVIDETEGVYVCYEDEAKMTSWCVKVRTN
jgi:hypothetical protein